jgi:hypothetical protein
VRIGVVNFFDAVYAPAGAISVPNKRAYCDRHGYDYLLSHEPLDSTRPASWTKLKLLQRHIDDYDVLFWNDTDTLIMNSEVKIESLLLPEVPLIVGSDDWGINCGNLIVQNTPQIQSILAEWWDKDDELTHPWWEQRALMELIRTRPEWPARVGIQPERVMNAHLNHYQDGDFLIHFAGFGRNLPHLVELMQAWS